MKWKFLPAIFAVALSVSINHSLVSAAEGTAKGETSDEKGQQGLGLGSAGHSSNVVMGGPDIVIGEITKIQGEQFSIKGDRGQEISLRVNKDTNKVCGEGQGTRFSTGQEVAKEHQEIPPTPMMEKQAGKSSEKNLSEQETMQQLHKDGAQKNIGALSKDPSKLKDIVGTTDIKAKEDVAKGSAFVVGGGDCKFQEGDQVRIEASDMGTATTIKQLQSSMKK